MATTVRLSKKFALQVPDFVRSAVMAALAAASTVILQSFEQGTLTFNWKVILTAAGAAFVSYLFKNGVLEPPKVITTASSNAVAQNKVEDIKAAV